MAVDGRSGCHDCRAVPCCCDAAVVAGYFLMEGGGTVAGGHRGGEEGVEEGGEEDGEMHGCGFLKFGEERRFGAEQMLEKF